MDLATATATEVSQKADLLPPQPADAAVAADAAAGVSAIRAVALATDPSPGAPVIAARKWRHGRRPVSGVSLVDRVLYRAGVELLSPALAPARADPDFESMEKAPNQPGVGYVVLTDLAHYYSTINVDRLARLVLTRSGEWAAVSWLREFLRQTSGGLGGLPQGSTTSDRLGDTYAQALLTQLRRRGLNAWSFADDFRIACSDYRDAVLALEVFDEEARAMALFVNERKTFTYGIEKYRQRLQDS